MRISDWSSEVCSSDLAATAIDPVNGNIFTSYYPYGAIIGLALDLRLRERYKRSLDDYMRHMWQRNGAAQVDYAPAKPYTPEDLQAGLAELTGEDRKSVV